MWDWSIWGALAVGALASVAALSFAAVRALRAWRDFKRLRRHVFRALDRLATEGERTAELAAQATQNEELERSLGRLRRSLARLAVLREALGEARETFGRFAVVMPRK